MDNSDPRLKLDSRALVVSHAPRRTRLTRCTVVGVLVVVISVGCAGDLPRIWEPREVVVAPIWLPGSSSILGYARSTNRSVLFDARNGTSRIVNFEGRNPWPVELSSDGKRVFGLDRSATKAWEVGSGRLIWQSPTVAWVACVTGTYVVLATKREVVLLDAENGSLRAVLEAEPYAGAQGVACSPDRRFLARHYREGIVSLWDITGQRKVGVLKATETDLLDVALGPRADWLAVWVDERVLLFRRDAWSEPGRGFEPDIARPSVETNIGLRHERQISKLILNPVRILHGVAFSSNGRYLAVTGISKPSGLTLSATYWQVLVNLDGMHVTRLPPDSGINFAFSPDSKYLAVSGHLIRYGFRIWDVRSGTFVTYPER